MSAEINQKLKSSKKWKLAENLETDQIPKLKSQKKSTKRKKVILLTLKNKSKLEKYN